MRRQNRRTAVLRAVALRLRRWSVALLRQIEAARRVAPAPPGGAPATEAELPEYTGGAGEGAGPPEHWLVRVEGAGPPEHWLARVREATAGGPPGDLAAESPPVAPAPPPAAATPGRSVPARAVNGTFAGRARPKPSAAGGAGRVREA